MLFIPLLVVALYLGFVEDDWFILQSVGVLALVMVVYGFISGKLSLSRLTNKRIESTLSYGSVAAVVVLAFVTT
jgi:hypothetical protein